MNIPSRVILAFIALLCCIRPTVAQQPLPALGSTNLPPLPLSTSARTPIPQWLGYYYFLLHVAKLQAVADQSLSNNGPDIFRHYFREKLALSPSEEPDLDQVASQFALQITSVNASIKQAREQFWSKYQPGQTPFSNIPPPPAIFASYSLTKETLSNAARAQLQGLLDPISFAKLDSFVTLHVIPKVNISRVDQPKEEGQYK